MKINSKVFSIIILTTLMVGLLSACQKELPKEQPTALIIIAGNHANSKKSILSLDSKIKNIYSLFGNINMVLIDGNPRIIMDEKGIPVGFCDEEFILTSKKQYQDNNEYWKMNYLTPLVSKVNIAVTTQYAAHPEVDTLKALQMAAKQLNLFESTMGIEIKKEIIIYDTGLSTTGKLSFLNATNNTLLGSQKRLWTEEEGETNVKKLVEQLDAEADIPNLQGVHITWYGLGAVGGDQEELSNLNIRNLQYIWGEILLKSGAIGNSSPGTNGADAEYGIFVDINLGEPIECSQKVTKVVFWQNVGQPLEGGGDYEAPPPIAPDTFFNGDEATFRKDIDPVALLKPWANNIKLYPNLRFLLVGSTADPQKHGGDSKLSKDRADAVYNVLVNQLGVDPSKLEAIGRGSKTPWYDENEWKNGKFITDSEAAKSNRAVRILPINSPLAVEILCEDYD